MRGPLVEGQWVVDEAVVQAHTPTGHYDTGGSHYDGSDEGDVFAAPWWGGPNPRPLPSREGESAQ